MGASPTTNATGTSPSRRSGTPTTAASRTRGERRSTSSTCSGNTLFPPRLITSPTRPSIQTNPSSSMWAMSPVRTKPSTSTRSASESPPAYPTARFGGRTSSSPVSGASRRSTPGCGLPTAPTFSGWAFASAAVHPITSPISACPYPFSTVTANFSVNRRAASGESGAVMLRTYRSGARSVTPSSSASIVIAAGGSTVERIACSRTSRANDSVANRSMITSAAPARRPKSAL